MYDLRYKPRHLPQISAPYNIIVDKLNNDGIHNEMVYVNPNNLDVVQAFTFNNEVHNDYDPENAEPAWITKDNKIIDGHHRFVSALKAKRPFKCIKIDLNERDAARVLNKIQDIYEYEQQLKIEEVVAQDVINMENQINSDIEEDFLKMLDEANIEINKEQDENQQTVVAYRQGPIKENSIIGNFFMLSPVDGYDKYEITFDNLLDTNDFGVVYRSGQVPTDILAKNWFPNVNFDSLSQPFGIPVTNLKNKAIAEKAKKMGYDGIKYGDIIIQGLK